MCTEKNEEKYPPIGPGVKVKTTKLNKKLINEWTMEALASKKWGVEAEVLIHHDSHGLSYEVKHSDGTIGHYDQSEIKVL